MREIKFKFWDGNFNKMIYSEQYSIDSNGRIFYGNADMTGYPLKSLQYTGLEDRNGNDLYFDSYIDVYFGKQKDERTVPISTLDDLFDLNRLVKEHGASFEIVGNIYEGVKGESE